MRQALILLLLAVALQIAGGMALAPVLTALGLSSVAAIGVINLFAIGVFPLGLALAQRGTTLPEVAPLRPVTLAQTGAIITTVLGLTIILSEIDNLVRLLLPMPAELSAYMMQLVSGQGGMLGSLFTIVVVAPVTEETLFRGIILRGFLSRYGVATAIAASSLLFALIHLNPWQFSSALIAGALFAWWRVRTGSLTPGLIGHAVINGVPLLAITLLPEIPGYTSAPMPVQFQPLWLDALAVTLTGVGLWASARAFGRDASDEG